MPKIRGFAAQSVQRDLKSVQRDLKKCAARFLGFGGGAPRRRTAAPDRQRRPAAGVDPFSKNFKINF